MQILSVSWKRLMDTKIILKIRLQEKSSTTISSFRSTEKEHDVYRRKDCMKKFWEFLREHAMKTIDFKKKKIKLLTKEQQESYENAKICYICK